MVRAPARPAVFSAIVPRHVVLFVWAGFDRQGLAMASTEHGLVPGDVWRVATQRGLVGAGSTKAAVVWAVVADLHHKWGELRQNWGCVDAGPAALTAPAKRTSTEGCCRRACECHPCARAMRSGEPGRSPHSTRNRVTLRRVIAKRSGTTSMRVHTVRRAGMGRPLQDTSGATTHTSLQPRPSPAAPSTPEAPRNTLCPPLGSRRASARSRPWPPRRRMPSEGSDCDLDKAH